MEWIKNTKDFLLLDGRVLAAKIREKPPNSRKLWEKCYLWFHDNFEMIIIIGGFVLLGLLIYTYLDDKGCSAISAKLLSKKNNRQTGGQPGETPSNNLSSSNSPDTPTASVGKTKNELRAEALREATEAAEANVAKKSKSKTPDGTTDNNKPSEGTNSTTEDKTESKKKLSIKTSIKNISGTATGKASAAWQSVKSGEALELGKEKFADALYNSKDFVRQYAKVGYALAFTIFMVAGFGLFFVPTLIMFIIGGITLAIFNKQKMAFFATT